MGHQGTFPQRLPSGGWTDVERRVEEFTAISGIQDPIIVDLKEINEQVKELENAVDCVIILETTQF